MEPKISTIESKVLEPEKTTSTILSPSKLNHVHEIRVNHSVEEETSSEVTGVQLVCCTPVRKKSFWLILAAVLLLIALLITTVLLSVLI